MNGFTSNLMASPRSQGMGKVSLKKDAETARRRRRHRKDYSSDSQIYANGLVKI